MLNTLLLNGAYADDPATEAVTTLATAELEELGATVAAIRLRTQRIGYCQGDFECWIKTPGVCRADDDSRDIARRFINSDLVVFLTPLAFGGYGSELKRAVDKLICLVSPFFETIRGEVHHQPRYPRYPRLLGIGVSATDDPEPARIFRTLVARNAINMHAPAHAAGVVNGGAPNGARAEIRTLLSAVGVAR